MNSIISKKSFSFSVRIVKLYQYLYEEKRERILSKQLLRSGTSIGANIAESRQAQSTADFISKMYIALKECSETKYWIRLLKATDYLTKNQADSLLEDCVEVEKILVTIIKSTKKNQGID